MTLKIDASVAAVDRIGCRGKALVCNGSETVRAASTRAFWINCVGHDDALHCAFNAWHVDLVGQIRIVGDALRQELIGCMLAAVVGNRVCSGDEFNEQLKKIIVAVRGNVLAQHFGPSLTIN